MLNSQVKLPTITRVILTPSPSQPYDGKQIQTTQPKSTRSNSVKIDFKNQGFLTSKPYTSEYIEEEQLEDVFKLKMNSRQRSNAQLLNELVSSSKIPTSLSKNNQTQSQNLNMSRDISHLLDSVVKQKKDNVLLPLMKNQPVNPNNSQSEDEDQEQKCKKHSRLSLTKQSNGKASISKEENKQESSLSKVTYNLSLVKDNSRIQTSQIQNEIKSIIQAIPEDKVSLQQINQYQYECESIIKPKANNT